MFDFVRKREIWDALGKGWRDTLGAKRAFDLKTIQDLAAYRLLHASVGLDIAEAGGGDSRLLRALAWRNRCVNIDKFEGADGGPGKEVKRRGVANVRAFLGEFDERLRPESFDIVFSISVVEHLRMNNLGPFLEDGMRILKPGGLWLHAIDVYLEDEPPADVLARIDVYRSWAKREGALDPVGPVFDGPVRFACDMATNPDNIMYEWGKIAPALIERRQRAQSVSLLIASRKR